MNINKPIPAEFVIELSKLINKYSLEELSDTPDGQLAIMLAEHLFRFSKAVQARESWYGRIPEPVATENCPR